MEDVIGVKDDIFFEEVICGITIEQGACTDHHETFVEVSGIEVGIHFGNWRLIVFRIMVAGGVRGDGSGCSDVCGEGGFDIEALSERRDGCSDDAF